MTPYPRALADWPILRQSTLAAFDECPLTWHLNDLYTKGWSTREQARGTLYHRWFAEAFHEMALQDEERLEVDVGLAILHEVLRQADVPDDEVVACPTSEIADMYWMVKKQCSEMTWNIAGLVDVERRLETKLYYPDPEGGSVERMFSGKLDVLFAEGDNLERAIVVDCKTGWQLPPLARSRTEGSGSSGPTDSWS